MKSSAIWIGEVEGKALVYDPAIQLPDCPHLFLWDPASGEMGKYIADLTRKRIKPHSVPSDANRYVAAYEQWRTTRGVSWLQEEKRYYEDRQSRETALENERKEAARRASLTPAERLMELHRHRLERLGKEYLGVRQATHGALHRVTHCYACKSPLDNSVDIECVACNWILCTCGACGCGYAGLA